MNYVKTYYKLTEHGRKIEEISMGDYLVSRGEFDTMALTVGADKKRWIDLHAVNCSLSDILNFLSKVK